MLHFRIPDMDCSGCVSKVTKAIQSIDADAQVNASLVTREVTIDTKGSEADIVAALEEFGYEVEKIDS